MKVRFSHKLGDILEMSADEALRTGHRFIAADHIMLACLRHSHNSACTLLEKAGIDCAELKDFIDSRVFREEALPYDILDTIRPRRESVELMCIAAYEALKSGDNTVRPIHLVLAASRQTGSACSEFLYEHGLDYDMLQHICLSNSLFHAHAENGSDETQKVLRALTDSLARTFNPEDNSRIFLS